VPFVEIYECVIIELESNIVLTTTSVIDYIRPNIPQYQFIKHVNGDIDIGISFLKLFK
jgi:hypothetical protein